MGRKQAFVDFIRQWCDDNSHGYSQVNRWGENGDCDCSSLMYMAAHAAGYDVPTSGVRYTGTMLRDFQAAGWQAIPFDGNLYDCKPGDIALNVANHVEAFVAPGMLGGAHIDEHGGVQGCCPGDQTGNEVSIGPAYVPGYGWDYILVPPAEDGEVNAPAVPDAPAPTVDLPMPRYRAYTYEEGWLEWMEGLRCVDNCGDTHAGITGHIIRAIEFDSTTLGANGWYQVWKDGEALPKNDTGESTGGSVTGVTVYYDTPDPARTGYYAAKYRAAPVGGDWLKWEYDDNDDGAGGAGPIDRFQCTIERI